MSGYGNCGLAIPTHNFALLLIVYITAMNTPSTIAKVPYTLAVAIHIQFRQVKLMVFLTWKWKLCDPVFDLGRVRISDLLYLNSPVIDFLNLTWPIWDLNIENPKVFNDTFRFIPGAKRQLGIYEPLQRRKISPGPCLLLLHPTKNPSFESHQFLYRFFWYHNFVLNWCILNIFAPSPILWYQQMNIFIVATPR